CQDGAYGLECSFTCGQCVEGAVCDKATGSCPSDCEPGYQAPMCQNVCASGLYGAGCASTCGQCLGGEACNHVTGICASGCEAGFIEPLCQTACSDGTYGSNCASTCGKCAGEAACDKATGSCPLGCEPGYQAPMCQDGNPTFYCMHAHNLLTGCNAGFYGDGCASACGNCMGGGACETTVGSCDSCEPGWQMPTCTAESVVGSREEEKRSSNTEYIIAGVVAGVVFISAIVGAAVYFIKVKHANKVTKVHVLPTSNEQVDRNGKTTWMSNTMTVHNL
ncbi:SREC2-like protein, partial [Mya arenaria]